MKARIPTPQEQITRKYEDGLKKSFVNGMAYGSKIFASTIKDMIDNNKDESYEHLVEKIKHFVEVTNQNSIEELENSYKNILERSNKILKTERMKTNSNRKDDVNG